MCEKCQILVPSPMEQLSSIIAVGCAKYFKPPPTPPEEGLSNPVDLNSLIKFTLIILFDYSAIFFKYSP
jgi:hypothetical protein